MHYGETFLQKWQFMNCFRRLFGANFGLHDLNQHLGEYSTSSRVRRRLSLKATGRTRYTRSEDAVRAFASFINS